MKQVQIIGFAVALVAGGAAFWLSRSLTQPPPKQNVPLTQALETVQVLVARTDIGLGQVASESNFRWQEWPKQGVSPSFLTRQAKPRAPTDLSGSIARTSITANEPITQNKLIKPGSGGVLAAILTPGMRAFSIKISEHTSVGRLILPNDHVDIMLASRSRGRSSGGGSSEEVNVEVILRNIRVLAIGQNIEVREGRKNADGNVAALELSPSQAETVAQATLRGELSLALRSVADIGSSEARAEERGKDRGNSVKVLRYGVRSKAYGVQ